MSCPFYKFESGGWFGGEYYCIKQKKAVDSDIYYKYCRNYDYNDCPIYKHDSSGSSCYLFILYERLSENFAHSFSDFGIWYYWIY